MNGLKKMLSLLSILFMFLQVPSQTNASNLEVNIKQIKDLQDVFITTLDPHISKAIREYYKVKGIPMRSYALWDAKILEIQRLEEGSFSFKVTIQIRTYTGTHNPPEGVETMTFNISPFGVKLLEFVHHEGEPQDFLTGDKIGSCFACSVIPLTGSIVQ
ncbi:DUF3888 domain-containing protein [Brevibacillus brevis]|uniref:DUF3888 domain-containing protein n=2 Tax=Brevibacillus TaxID=55080 RepID=A0A2Z4MCX1_BREBE|nr:DUF3888 domain-containing protein [Brevibacillus brevis]NRR19688.1 DUF3888 domain-containing protein [Brevibacillus sp. MS2.2]